ncbi:hypothetical protein TNCV_3314541 [Trichonephila clavipes]|nr:hypothetical protein TNCV_3314541 [Trichonephila clavipes]
MCPETKYRFVLPQPQFDARANVSLLVHRDAIPSRKKVCILGWTWSVKISLHFSPVILPFWVSIDLAENYETTAQIMIDPPPCLTVGSQTIMILRLCPRNVHPSCRKEKCGRRFFSLYNSHPFINLPGV